MKNLRALSLIIAVLAACSKNKNNTPPPSPDTDGLHVVSESYLADGSGNKVTLIGVNVGCLWADGLGMNELPEVEKTGANAVRLMLQTSSDNSNPQPMTAAQIEPLITYCIGKNIIPVLCWYGETGSADVSGNLSNAVAWWSGDGIKSMLMKYQKSIIINIANEPADENTSNATFTAATINAIKAMRSAGFSCPLLVDVNNWGHDADYAVSDGKQLIDADPLQNVVISVHAYWTVNGGTGAYSDNQVAGFINNLHATGLPVVIGELAWGLERDGADFTDPNNYDVIDYQVVLAACRQNGMGYMVWQWGFRQPDGSRNAGNISADGTYGGLTPVGLTFVLNDPYAIKTNAKRANL